MDYFIQGVRKGNLTPAKTGSALSQKWENDDVSGRRIEEWTSIRDWTSIWVYNIYGRLIQHVEYKTSDISRKSSHCSWHCCKKYYHTPHTAQIKTADWNLKHKDTISNKNTWSGTTVKQRSWPIECAIHRT